MSARFPQGKAFHVLITRIVKQLWHMRVRYWGRIIFCYTPEVFLSRECEEVVHVVDLKKIKGKHYVSTIVTRS